MNEKNVELRLADFNIKPGDTLRLREWDPQTRKYTGRTLDKLVDRVNRVNPLGYYSVQQIDTHGMQLIELT